MPIILPKMFRHLFFLLVVEISVEKCWSLKQREVNKRVGVKMCRDICQSYLGCTCFRFSPVSLTCTVMTSACRQEDFRIDTHKAPEMIERPLFKKCITTKGGRSVCTEIAVTETQDGETGGEGKLKNSNILTVVQFSTKVEFRFYNPNTHQFMSSVASCQSGLIHAVIYVKTQETVLLAVRHARQMKIMFLKKELCSTLEVGIICSAMKLHHLQNRVYIIRSASDNVIIAYTMSTDGSDLVSRFNITGSKSVSDMALDEREDVMYVSTKSSIIAFTTQGQMKMRLAITSVGPLCLDPTGITLYYGKRSNIFQFNIVTNASQKLGRCCIRNYAPKSIEWVMDKLFLSSSKYLSYAIIENWRCKSMKLKQKSACGLYFAP